MALLSRIRASTLMETLVATVLIVVVFAMASMLLNNWLGTSLTRRMQGVENRLLELQYAYENGTLILPYTEEHLNWTFQVEQEYMNQRRNLDPVFLKFSAVHEVSGHKIEKRRAVKK